MCYTSLYIAIRISKPQQPSSPPVEWTSRKRVKERHQDASKPNGLVLAMWGGRLEDKFVEPSLDRIGFAKLGELETVDGNRALVRLDHKQTWLQWVGFLCRQIKEFLRVMLQKNEHLLFQAHSLLEGCVIYISWGIPYTANVYDNKTNLNSLLMTSDAYIVIHSRLWIYLEHTSKYKGITNLVMSLIVIYKKLSNLPV